MDIEHKINALLSDHNKNVGTTSRIVSAAAGAYLLYDSLFREKKSIPEAVLAGYLLFRGVSGFCPVSKVVGIGKNGEKDQKLAENINIRTNLSINKNKKEVYEFWRKLDNLPLFMKHLEYVKDVDGKLSEWSAKIPGDMGTIVWISEIVKDIPNEHIGWRSLPGSTIDNAGNVKFKDAGKYGTEVQVVISYQAPAGMLGEGIGRMFTNLFEELLLEDIKNLKRYLESGEIASTEGQAVGTH